MSGAPPPVRGLRALWAEAEAKAKADGITAKDAMLGDHVVRFEVFDPDDHFVAPYSGNYLAHKGVLKRSIQLALNDRPGAWRFRATEVASGLVAEGTVTIEVPAGSQPVE